MKSLLKEDMAPPAKRRQMMQTPTNDISDSRLNSAGLEKNVPFAGAGTPVSRPSPVLSSLGKPVVDLQRLWNCADEDRQELQRLAGNYLREMEAQLGQMEKAVAGGECSEMARLAHRSCGASATFGMVAITIPLGALEHIGRTQSMKGAEIHLAQAWRQLELIRNFFKAQPEAI